MKKIALGCLLPLFLLYHSLRTFPKSELILRGKHGSTLRLFDWDVQAVALLGVLFSIACCGAFFSKEGSKFNKLTFIILYFSCFIIFILIVKILLR